MNISNSARRRIIVDSQAQQKVISSKKTLINIFIKLEKETKAPYIQSKSIKLTFANNNIYVFTIPLTKPKQRMIRVS